MYSTFLAFAGDRDLITAVASGRAPSGRGPVAPTRPFRSLARLRLRLRRSRSPLPSPTGPAAPVARPWRAADATTELGPASAC